MPGLEGEQPGGVRAEIAIEGCNVYISARERIGVSQLAELISRNVLTDYIQCSMLIPFDKGSVVAYLKENAYVQSIQYESEGSGLCLMIIMISIAAIFMI
ncbi:MAG TPA: hypothetical protein VN580_09545 [Clostridia bacterium]|nr:hypothetical protein [Clostridia bacterium]